MIRMSMLWLVVVVVALDVPGREVVTSPCLVRQCGPAMAWRLPPPPAQLAGGQWQRRVQGIRHTIDHVMVQKRTVHVQA